MSPKWLQNGSQKPLKWLPGALWAAFGVAGGAWEAKVRILSDLESIWGPILGSKIVQHFVEIEAQIEHYFFYRHFLASGGLRGHFWGSFWIILVCFWAAQPRRGQNRENHEK